MTIKLFFTEPQNVCVKIHDSRSSAVKDTIESSRAAEPIGRYAHAKRVGNLLFLAGIGPRVRGSQEIPGVELGPNGEIVSHDIEAQCHSAFRNVRMILEDAGSSWRNIVDVTVFLTHMRADFQRFNRIYAEYFKDILPSRTTVEVGALPTPIAIELKVIATVGQE
jgi:2-aminomuconate deaminase